MPIPTWLRTARLGFGALAIIAVIWEFIQQNRHQDTFVASNFWSLFTNHANLFAGAVLIAGALLPASRQDTRGWELFRGAAIMYMVTTGIVYATLVGGLFNPFDEDRTWMSSVLHQVIPIVMVLDLLIRPPAIRLTFRESLIWTAYPIAFLIYSLVRGPIVDWYPYHFIDPNEVGGYARVAVFSLAITAGFLLMAAFVVSLSRAATHRVSR